MSVSFGALEMSFLHQRYFDNIIAVCWSTCDAEASTVHWGVNGKWQALQRDGLCPHTSDLRFHYFPCLWLIPIQLVVLSRDVIPCTSATSCANRSQANKPIADVHLQRSKFFRIFLLTWASTDFLPRSCDSQVCTTWKDEGKRRCLQFQAVSRLQPTLPLPSYWSEMRTEYCSAKLLFVHGPFTILLLEFS